MTRTAAYSVVVSALASINVTVVNRHWVRLLLEWVTASSSSLANSSVEHCRTDDLTPNVPISCLPSSRVDPRSSRTERLRCPKTLRHCEDTALHRRCMERNGEKEMEKRWHLRRDQKTPIECTVLVCQTASLQQ